MKDNCWQADEYPFIHLRWHSFYNLINSCGIITVLLIPWFVISSSFSYNWRQKYVRQKNIRRCQDAKKALFHYFNEYNVPINTPLPRHNSPGHTELDLIISRFGFKHITWLFTFSPGFHYITLNSLSFIILFTCIKWKQI